MDGDDQTLTDFTEQSQHWSRPSSDGSRPTRQNPPLCVRQTTTRLPKRDSGSVNDLSVPESVTGIIGEHPKLQRVLKQAEQIAPLPITTLITGESGTGKELLVRLLHNRSPRRNAPFITVNCAALPEALVESELFGHQKGAFTGAVSLRKGKFELAQGGTLFLDEIGELCPQAQAKLLRVLQEKEITRLGGALLIPVDVRVVAATNQTLAEEVRQGRFRENLYYRLRVLELQCPPLRERKEDIPALTQHFVRRYCDMLGKPIPTISPAAMERLCSYEWPGNIRELENLTVRTIVLATGPVLGPEDIPTSSQAGEIQPVAATEYGIEDPLPTLIQLCGLSMAEFAQDGWNRLMRACERICLQSILGQTLSQKEAAEVLGLTPSKLHRLIKKHSFKRFNNAFRN